MSQERKGASKLWRMISFSRDLTHVWLKFRKRLLFSSASGTPTQNPALHRWQAAGRNISPLPIRFVMQRVLRQFQVFQAKQLLYKNGQEDPSTAHKWLRGPIYKVLQWEHLKKESEHEKWVGITSPEKVWDGISIQFNHNSQFWHRCSSPSKYPKHFAIPMAFTSQCEGVKKHTGMEMTQNLTHPFWSWQQHVISSFQNKVKTFADQVDAFSNQPFRKGVLDLRRKTAYIFGGSGFDLNKSCHAVTPMHNICQ